MKHVLAYVEWLLQDTDRDILGSQIEIWQKSLYLLGTYSFIPVVRIRHLVAFCTVNISGDVYVTVFVN